jgi:hypothetical protein
VREDGGVILHLRAAVEQLYAVTPPEFTPLRTRLAKEAKAAGAADLAASVTKLRKPTVAAWAVNHFVREQGESLEDLRSFAELLREAQRTLDAGQLRTLGRERASRVDAVADLVAELAAEAGHPLGAGVAQEVRETLTALVSDEDAEASVLTGALVRSLSYSGFGSVDIDDVVAIDDPDLGGERGSSRPSRPSLSVLRGGRSGSSDASEGSEGAATADAGDPPEARAAAAAAREAAKRARLTTRLDTAREALRVADRQVAVLGARQEEVREGIADLERRLATARARLEKVTGELTEADGIREQAQQRHDEAATALADFVSTATTV